MRSALPLLALVAALPLASCESDPPPPIVFAVPPPPGAFPSPDVAPQPAASAPDAAPPPEPPVAATPRQPRKGSSAAARGPRSFGIAACDRYARKACSCPDPLLRERLCRDAHRSFGEWKKIAAHEGMRSFVVQSCEQSTRSIAAACR